MAFAAGAFAIADDRKRNADSRESRANAANPVAQRYCRSADANILFAKRVSTGADDANEFSYPMIPREILKKIRQIELRTNRIVTETLAGQYHSVFKGQGMNFDEVREYQPGDDVRAIDWNVTARMNHPFIKKFVEERELTLMLVVDVS